MITNVKQSGEILLQNEDLRAICGGTAAAVSASFPCTVKEADGTIRSKEVSSIEECLEFAGMN